MQEQSPAEGNNLVELWEKMGASTGSLLGKIIGLTAQYGLQSYQQAVVQPLRQYTSDTCPPPSETGIPSNIRQQTWSEMGKEYGESLGMTLDLLIKAVESSAQTNIPGFNQRTGPES